MISKIVAIILWLVGLEGLWVFVKTGDLKILISAVAIAIVGVVVWPKT